MHFRLTVIIFAVLMFSANSTMAQRISYPEVTFEYSPFFDAPCAEITKQPIEPEAIKELEDRLDSFREHWRKDAPKLFETTVKITGVKFQFREPSAVRNHLHLFSIMNEVYRKLERQKDLDAVIAFEQTLKSAPILKRAREIVNKEGAEAFLREIRKSR